VPAAALGGTGLKSISRQQLGIQGGLAMLAMEAARRIDFQELSEVRLPDISGFLAAVKTFPASAALKKKNSDVSHASSSSAFSRKKHEQLFLSTSYGVSSIKPDNSGSEMDSVTHHSLTIFK
jgi:hypothetical protein